MDASDLEKLRAKGWTQAPNGEWYPPRKVTNPPLDIVEARQSEQSQARALDQRVRKHQKGEGCVCLRVVMVAFRRRGVDRDAVAFSMKALTDSVAASLGVDDEDLRVAWEWRQVETNGQEGVLVKVEEV